MQLVADGAIGLRTKSGNARRSMAQGAFRTLRELPNLEIHAPEGADWALIRILQRDILQGRLGGTTLAQIPSEPIVCTLHGNQMRFGSGAAAFGYGLR